VHFSMCILILIEEGHHNMMVSLWIYRFERRNKVNRELNRKKSLARF
jgi:hypothetical protein